MEDLKRRILKIVSNCHKPKVRTPVCTDTSVVLRLGASCLNIQVFFCVPVPYSAAGMLV